MAYFNVLAAATRSVNEPFLRSSNESMECGDSRNEVVGVAVTMSATGSATDDEEEDSGRDLDDLEVVKPRKTFANPPERDESGEVGPSPAWGDMCSVDGRSCRQRGWS
jgi:hypothetical protein